MDILWPAVGISIIVGFVFYVMAERWGRILRRQAVTIRQLSDRVQMIEEVDNPVFRERISESAPAPLEQVFTFSFRFSDRFWRETLGLLDGDRDYVRRFGSFVGSVKLERWRSHSVATITEILPDRKTAAWQARSLDYFHAPGERGEPLTLWQLPLARPQFGCKPASLELSLCGNAMELAMESPGGNESEVLLRVPLDPGSLEQFRSHDPAESANSLRPSNGNGLGSWRAFYAFENETTGIEWQLRTVDLTRKIDWERWKILESATPQAMR